MMRLIAKAISVLFTQGPFSLIQKVRARLRPSPVEEGRIAFAVLAEDPLPATMIDVGAHHGSTLMPFALRGWGVLALEPDSSNRAKLHANVAGLRNVIIDARAASDQRSSSVPLFRSPESTGISGLSAFRTTHAAAETVEVVTLEDAMLDSSIESVDFLKIDTEGFDLHVLRGFPWHRMLPRLVLCEFEDRKTIPLGYDFHALAQFLRERGYSVLVSEWFPIVKYGVQHRWRSFREYPCELADPAGWGNLIAARDRSLFSAVMKEAELAGKRSRRGALTALVSG